jgi:predicted TIM-barrel fold metal-dependent hydrolase
MDNSLNQSVDVTREAISVLGSSRILYGSDEPLNLIRYVAYKHPEKGQRIVSDYPYHWVDSDEFREYGHFAKEAIHSHWGNLLALKQCVEELPKEDRQSAKENIFHKNANSVYSF